MPVHSCWWMDAWIVCYVCVFKCTLWWIFLIFQDILFTKQKVVFFPIIYMKTLFITKEEQLNCDMGIIDIDLFQINAQLCLKRGLSLGVSAAGLNKGHTQLWPQGSHDAWLTEIAGDHQIIELQFMCCVSCVHSHTRTHKTHDSMYLYGCTKAFCSCMRVVFVVCFFCLVTLNTS